MVSGMYETELVEDRRRELLEGAREYRLAKQARGHLRGGRRGRRSADQVA